MSYTIRLSVGDLDLSIILSIIAIVVSVVVSGVTLLLTQFQGPDISLISSSEFEVDDRRTDERFKGLLKQGDISPLLDLKPTSFVFANHGGKSGTILRVDFVFTPTEEFAKFFFGFYPDLSVSTAQEGLASPGMPATIVQGDNKVFIASARIHLVDWKKMALAEVLDSTQKIEDLIESAVRKSRKNFESFSDLMSKSKTLGTVNCTISFTKGRFRTKVVTERLVEKNTPLTNDVDTAYFSFNEILQKWENMKPTRTQMLNEAKGDLESITKELKDNLLKLNMEVRGQNLAGSRLSADAWRQLCNESRQYDEKIRWFLIRSESGLEQELTELYSRIDRYNSLIEDVLARGEFRTPKNFTIANEERIKLKSDAQEVGSRLSELYQRRIP